MKDFGLNKIVFVVNLEMPTMSRKKKKKEK